jgi:hypothetical protein
MPFAPAMLHHASNVGPYATNASVKRKNQNAGLAVKGRGESDTAMSPAAVRAIRYENRLFASYSACRQTLSTI